MDFAFGFPQQNTKNSIHSVPDLKSTPTSIRQRANASVTPKQFMQLMSRSDHNNSNNMDRLSSNYQLHSPVSLIEANLYKDQDTFSLHERILPYNINGPMLLAQTESTQSTLQFKSPKAFMNENTAEELLETISENETDEELSASSSAVSKRQHRIYNWYLVPVTNEPRETGVSCPKWVIIEGYNEDGTIIRQSSRIVQVFDKRIVQTNSGSEYQLAGTFDEAKMKEKFSLEFCRKFSQGFPSNWKTYILKEFVSEKARMKDAKITKPKLDVNAELENRKNLLQVRTLRKQEEKSPLVQNNQLRNNLNEKEVHSPKKQKRMEILSKEKERQVNVTNNSKLIKKSSKIEHRETKKESILNERKTRSGRKSIKPLQYWNNEYRKLV